MKKGDKVYAVTDRLDIVPGRFVKNLQAEGVAADVVYIENEDGLFEMYDRDRVFKTPTAAKNLMQEMKIELAAEYLLMAAMLAEIKSRLLLPRPQEEEGDEGDPRAELVKRLQEYERYKKAAEDLSELPQEGRDTFRGTAKPPVFEREIPEPQIEMKELMLAFNDVINRAKLYTHHRIQMETFSVRERMSIIIERLNQDEYVQFSALFTVEEGRKGVVVTFIAILALLRDAVIEIVQPEPYAPIYLKGSNHEA